MRNTFSLLTLAALAAALCSGCANVETKFSRGLSNTYEIVRLGEMRRTVEQTALFDSPDQAYTYGFVHGFNRTLARTGIGLYEIVTAPFPPYGPVYTDHFSPNPVYPDNYTPTMMEDSMFATDTSLGYSGGDILPFVPGSRFRVFDSP